MSDKIFGVPRENAPPLIPPQFRGERPVIITLPDGTDWLASYAEAEDFHRVLGQILARGLRKRGSSREMPLDPNSGGTPAALAVVA
jgi:hypothetical protein